MKIFKQKKQPIKKIILLILFSLTWHLHSISSEEDTWSSYKIILENVVIINTYQGIDGKYFHNSVDYQKLKTHSPLENLFLEQVKKLEQLDKKNLKKFSTNESLAFWINAYNFFTLKDIRDNYPIKTIKQIGWNNKKFNIAGKKYSLDNIEHDIIRKLNNPLIHFAINAASVGSPSLQKTIFKSATLEANLKYLVKNAFRNPIHLQIEETFLLKKKIIKTTKVFSWYELDFIKQGTVLDFIKKYAPIRYREINDYKANINFNWNLNTLENNLYFFRKINTATNQ